MARFGNYTHVFRARAFIQSPPLFHRKNPHSNHLNYSFVFTQKKNKQTNKQTKVLEQVLIPCRCSFRCEEPKQGRTCLRVDTPASCRHFEYREVLGAEVAGCEGAKGANRSNMANGSSEEFPKCSTLFLTEDGSPMHFYMSPSSMKTRLRPLIYVSCFWILC